MSSTPKFAHVVFQTSQLDAMRDWYCTVLNARVVHEGHGLCFITFDDEHHRIALISVPTDLPPRSTTNAGMHHVAYTFDTLDDLLDRYTDLEKKGISPKVPIQHGVTTSLYYQDPDGNFVEMQIDNFATPSEATSYMEGPEYAADNVGVGFKPELMREARAAGTPVETLTTRAWALETSPNLPNPLEALMA
jgi:catechol-2,3-dioxygenase